MALMPRPDTVRAREEIDLTREGVDRTQFFYSFSGALIVDEGLPILSAHVEGHLLEISAPLRIGAPSFRPTPQLTFENVRTFYDVPIPTPFPIQLGAFPGKSNQDGARFDCWFGPSSSLALDAPKLPGDTLLVTLWGPDSPNQHEKIERLFLEPLLDWLRVLTKQWWIGRSIEGVTGSLHFVAPLNAAGATVGCPTPMARLTSAGPEMQPITRDIWVQAAQQGFGGIRPSADQSLAMDADFALASQQFRSAVILACCAVEAARDNLLARANVRLTALKTPKTDLLKHLSDGLGFRFGRSLAVEEPALFEILTAVWRARGQAAHGKAITWRTSASESDIEDVKFGTISEGISKIIEWINAIRTEDA